MIGFTRAVARESSRFGVRVNAVAPGPIDTPLLNAAPEELGEIGERLKAGMIAATSMRRIGQPEEVAADDRVPGERRRVVRHRADDQRLRRALDGLNLESSAVQVAIREVGPRDGFQNEPEVVPTDEKVRLIELLAASGLRAAGGHELRAART